MIRFHINGTLSTSSLHFIRSEERRDYLLRPAVNTTLWSISMIEAPTGVKGAVCDSKPIPMPGPLAANSLSFSKEKPFPPCVIVIYCEHVTYLLVPTPLQKSQERYLRYNTKILRIKCVVPENFILIEDSFRICRFLFFFLSLGVKKASCFHSLFQIILR